MPELPEVETIRRGLAPLLTGSAIRAITVRETRLRWPVEDSLRQAQGQTIVEVQRRGKYLLLDCGAGTLLIHLGMSGSLRVLPQDTPPQKHDHVDLVLSNGSCLRYHDPRRFGCVLWQEGEIGQHPLLASLGPEPLGEEFSGHYLRQRAQGKQTAVKLFIMDSHVVVGVGNIYASESLFAAGIAPARPAGKISAARYETLAAAIRATLQSAIEQGGTTLRDFMDSAGKPGYFQQSLAVYGREGLPCPRCAAPIRRTVLGQRATYHCPRCQAGKR